MQSSRSGLKRKTIAYALVIAMVLALIPEFKITLPVHAAAEFGGDPNNPVAVYIDSSYNGQTIYIKNGVFSVTVDGATDVNLIFGERTADGAVGVTIDRRHATSPSNDTDEMNGKTVENLYAISQNLGAQGTAQTCPLLITGDSTVTATFHGVCRFYAGTNASTVNNRNVYTAATGGNGFAGIQVDSGSTLTIEGADDLMVFGGHQFGIPNIDSDADGKADSLTYSHNNGTRQFVYSDILRAHRTITVNINGQSTTIYTNPSTISDYAAPSHATHHEASGGAGIGGGPTLTTENTGRASFTNGAPGNIIINGGNIEAFGGHQAAGIGGAVNSAATTGMIQINGGKVIAHGGRWAAGIGDGDSVTDPDISSTFETATSLIEINGGTVEAYGGVASSGIGTTDEISDDAGIDPDFVRNMQINLNGGVIRAYSGFPKEFNGSNFPTEAPAAIGAGSKTMTPGNSLHVSADADLRCAGFGNYALTENGQEADAVPNISVDSDGYLLLLRTGESNSDSYHSSATRTLTLYSPVEVSFLGEDGWTVYVDQSNKTALVRYLVSPSGTVYVENAASGTESAFGTKWSIADGNLPGAPTLYINDKESSHYDSDFPASTVLETIEMAYFFRSIALTLPDPEKHGGLYALGVPMEGISNSNLPSSTYFDQISLTVEAKEQGTQSGWIDFPSTNNLGKDNTAGPLTRLDVNGNAGTLGLIGNQFLSGVYAYTVYVEPGTPMVDLYLTFDQKVTNGNNVHHKIELDSPIDNDDAILRNDTIGDTVFLVEDLTLSSTETVFRIKKTDANNPLGTVSYKITVIVKGDYLLDISAESKIYDGNPADVSVTGVSMYPLIYEATEFPGSTATVTLTPEKQTYNYRGSAYVSRSGSYNNYTYYAANLSYTLQIIPDGNTIYYVLLFDQRTSANNSSLSNLTTKYAAVWKISTSNNSTASRVTKEGDLPNSVISSYDGYNPITDTGTNVDVNLATGNGANLVLRVSANSASLRYGNTNGTLLTIGSIPRNSSTTSKDTTSAAAEAQALAAIQDRKTSGAFPYEVSSTTSTSQTITVNTFAWQQNSQTTSRTDKSFTYPISGQTTYTERGTWVITGRPDTTKTPTPVDIPESDLKLVEYVYYQTHAADGTKLATEKPLDLDGPPTNAGVYRVVATLKTGTYNASTPAENLNAATTLDELDELKTVFIISQRPLKVLRIENWLEYVDKAPALSMDQPKVFETTDGSLAMLIPDPGYIELDDVIQEDKEQVKFVLPNTADYPTLPVGKAYYDDPGSDSLAVDYRSDKIVLANGILDGGQAHNYRLDYTDPSMIRVYGQIAYEVNGTIFRKDEGTEADWRKYYPVDSPDNAPVGGGTAPDYHSPPETNTEHGKYLTHAEYIRARTLNQGNDEARYCIDIEYGAMSFGFYRSIWDVSELDYDETNTSHWTGMDGSNNKLTIVNYSNRPVEYTLSLTRDAQFGGKIDFAIKTANVTTGGNSLISMTGTTMSAESGKYEVAAATAGSGVGASGEEARTSSYVILSGVPQYAEGINPSVGIIGISFSPASDDS